MVNNESVVLTIFTFEVLEWTCFSEHWCCKQSIAVCYLWIELSALVGQCFWYCSLLHPLGALVAAAGLLFFPRGILCISRACLQGQDLWGSAVLVVYISMVLRCWDGSRTRSSRRNHCRALVSVWEQVGGSCGSVLQHWLQWFTGVCRWTHLLCCLFLLLSASYFLVPVSKCCLINHVVPSLFHFLPPRNSSLHSVCSQPPGHSSCP